MAALEYDVRRGHCYVRSDAGRIVASLTDMGGACAVMPEGDLSADEAKLLGHALLAWSAWRRRIIPTIDHYEQTKKADDHWTCHADAQGNCGWAGCPFLVEESDRATCFLNKDRPADPEFQWRAAGDEEWHHGVMTATGDVVEVRQRSTDVPAFSEEWPD